jgi:cell division protease FtsH
MSTGAEEDIEKATEVARDIVGRYGMSPALGRTRLIAADVDQYLGGNSTFAQISSQTHEDFDAEIQRLVSAGEAEATRILSANRELLDELAERLEQIETLEGKALDEILRNVPVDEAGLGTPFSGTAGNGSGPALPAAAAKRSS